MLLPEPYRWLAREPGPKHLVYALSFYGTKEIVGQKHNPRILGWARELGDETVFMTDETPWCGLFVGYTQKLAGRTPPLHWYRAKAWADWGEGHLAGGGAQLGDVLVFWRAGGGHVGYYVGEDKSSYHVLGGNQDNQVGINRLPKVRLLAIRRPRYVNKPSNVRRVSLAAHGAVSTNEA